MIDSDKRTKLALAAAVLGPLAAIVLIRSALSASGPASASAQPLSHTGEPLPIFEPKALTNEQVLTRGFLDNYELTQSSGTPFLLPTVRVIQATDTGNTIVDPGPIERTIEPPRVMLSSILGSGSRAIAVIDSRMLRTGDELPSGWIIESIDGTAFKVVLTHPDAKEPVTLQMNTPGHR